MSASVKDRIFDRAKSMKVESDPYCGDFHSTNTRAVFADDFHQKFISESKDDQLKAKSLRAIGKGLGLSLLYQATRSSAGYTLYYNSGVGDSPEEAQVFADKWYNGVPNFWESLNNYIRDGKKTGITQNAFGRKRYIPRIISGKTRQEKEYNARVATNFCIQGLGGEQIKLGNKEVHNFIEEYNLNNFQGNLAVYNDSYTRIICIPHDSEKLNEFSILCDSLPKGNVKVLITENGNPIKEYDANLQITGKHIREFGLEIVW